MTTSLLTTDGYKFSMAEAGWPLRRETFYYAHRRGGPQLVPTDLAAAIAAMLPAPAAGDYEYLAANQYEMGAGFKAAVQGGASLVVRGAPRGAWVLRGEPVLTLSGPSALVSWLEPLVLQLHYRLQLATLAVTDPAALARALAWVTCPREAEIARETLDAVGVSAPPIEAREEEYAARVAARAAELVGIVEDGARLFEVGLRSASCAPQHMIALAACKQAGIGRTSHVLGARRLGLIPVGTMGHEHVMRYGADEAAFRAMKERRPQRSSFLLDTFDTLRSGLPKALALMAEDPSAHDSIRYDSGDKEAQYAVAVREAARLGVRPVHILEDGFDAAQTRRFESLREEHGVRPDEQFYGYGGWLVAGPSPSGLTRDRVSAAYKLCWSGGPVMKFSNDVGKRSLPGKPVVWRRVSGSGPLGVIAQEGEPVRAGYTLLSGAPDAPGGRPAPGDAEVAFSEETGALARRLTRDVFEREIAERG